MELSNCPDAGEIQLEKDYQECATQRKAKLAQVSSPSPERLTYLTITDLHCEEPEAWEGMSRQLTQIVQLSRECPLDFIFVGGDLLRGRNPYPEIGSKQNNLSYVRRMVQILRGAHAPVFFAFGNHDDNAHHWEDDTRPSTTCPIGDIITKREFCTICIDPLVTVVHDTENPLSCYYYYDIESKKTRVIVLDTTDYPLTNRKDPRYADLNGRTQLRVSARQIQWLCEQALTQKDAGWKYIILSHVPLSVDFMGAPTQVAAYGTWIWDALCALNHRSVYSRKDAPIACGDGKECLTVHADFSDFHSRVVLHHFGHVHFDGCTIVDDIACICTANAWCENYTEQTIVAPKNTALENYHFYNGRHLGDLSEALFDISTFVPGDVYHRIRFGTGEDTCLSWKK